MASVPPLPFSNDEKNFLLAEIVKSVSPSPTLLLEVCNRLRIEPTWNDMPLPPGRSVNACKAAYEEMRRIPIQYSPLSQTPTGQTIIGQTPLSAAVPTLTRPTDIAYATGRKILPRQAPYSYSPVMSEQQPLKRKRGRPTKAEVQARADAASSSSVVDPSTPIPRLQTPMSASVPPSPGIDIRPPSNLPPPVTRGLPISAMITTPVAASKSASHSSSSSGKRRRQRRSEEMMKGIESAAQTEQTTLPFFSPTRQPLSGYDESAVRSSSMRRPDETIHTSVARLDVSEPEQTAGADQLQPTSSSQLPSPGRRIP